MEVFPKGNKVVQLLAVILMMRESNTFLLIGLIHDFFTMLHFGEDHRKNIRSDRFNLPHPWKPAKRTKESGHRHCTGGSWEWMADYFWQGLQCERATFAKKTWIFWWVLLEKVQEHMFFNFAFEQSSEIENLSRPKSFSLMVSTFPTEQHFLSKFRLSRDCLMDLKRSHVKINIKMCFKKIHLKSKGCPFKQVPVPISNDFQDDSVQCIFDESNPQLWIQISNGGFLQQMF